jgi:beta-phosphoglucomutase-like phosphatase (HAD superfamily)
LRVTNLLPRFVGNIFSSYQIGSWKPEPDLFLYAAKTMEVDPQFCTVVEDSILGVRAGLTAGMRVLWYTNESENTLFATSGVNIFQSMNELPTLLARD